MSRKGIFLLLCAVVSGVIYLLSPGAITSNAYRSNSISSIKSSNGTSSAAVPETLLEMCLLNKKSAVYRSRRLREAAEAASMTVEQYANLYAAFECRNVKENWK